MTYKIKKAKLSHAKEIHALVKEAAAEDKMLPRALGEIYESIRDFFVALDDTSGAVIGCCALQIAWDNLAEVRSLAVVKEGMGKGVGKALIEFCIEDANEMKIKRVFALTYVEELFIKMGFNKISKEELPHKVWTVCIKCHKFPDCDEQAVAIDLF